MLFEPIAVAFANTRSSSRRDRIGTLAEWRTWIAAWPGLRAAGLAIDANDFGQLRVLRDEIQSLLRNTVKADRPGTSAEAVLRLARSIPAVDLRWRSGRACLDIRGGATPATVIMQYLACAAVEVLVTGPPLAACQGRDCNKLFVVSKPNRRWCDSTVCGNRARVSAHSQRRARRTDTSRDSDLERSAVPPVP